MEKFVTELKTLKDLPCVQSQQLVVGGPSITTPIERSKGFQIALLSFHKDLAALEEYQSSREHHRYAIAWYSGFHGFAANVGYVKGYKRAALAIQRGCYQV
jgi:hypothetical protein